MLNRKTGRIAAALLVAGCVVAGARWIRQPTAASVSWGPVAPKITLMQKGTQAPEFTLPTTTWL